jgi:hypothetical protein
MASDDERLMLRVRNRHPASKIPKVTKVTRPLQAGSSAPFRGSSCRSSTTDLTTYGIMVKCQFCRRGNRYFSSSQEF